MKDINDIAVTLHTNTKQQGVTLLKVNENVDVAHTNATDAHENIEKAAKHQKSGNKCLCWILSVTGLCAIVILALILIFSLKKK